MTIVGERLARAQLDGMMAIDAIYRELARDVHNAVMARATPDAKGILRLSLPTRFAILTELGRLLDAIRPRIFTAILGAVKSAESAAQVGFDPLPRDITGALDLYATVPLSLQRNRSNVISQTGVILIRGIAGNLPASAVAKRAKDYFSPWFSQYRDEAGKLLHADRPGAVRSWPGQAGMASAHARLVMLSETTAAHGRIMRRLAERNSMGLKWNLSANHIGHALCVANAQRDSGFGPGVYRSGDAPSMPQHPRCRCFLTTVPLLTEGG